MHWNDAGILLLILLAMIALLLVLLHRTRLGSLLHERIADRPRRRLFLASVSFFLTFAIVRGWFFASGTRFRLFTTSSWNGRHIHHLVPGILLLLAVGYGWLCEFGTGSDSSSRFASRLMSLLYGVGAALTLDEFALWLNLKDVYFVREGRSSIDAVVLFGSLLAIGGWGAPLFAALAKRMPKQSR
jgi:branched-subunit amino acid ABC-type transport system permease component